MKHSSIIFLPKRKLKKTSIKPVEESNTAARGQMILQNAWFSQYIQCGQTNACQSHPSERTLFQKSCGLFKCRFPFLRVAAMFFSERRWFHLAVFPFFIHFFIFCCMSHAKFWQLDFSLFLWYNCWIWG